MKGVTMNHDYYADIWTETRELSEQYNNDISKLEKEKTINKQNKSKKKEIDEEIKKRTRRLLNDIKGSVHNASSILVSGVIDKMTTWWNADFPRKENVKNLYIEAAMEIAENGFALPDCLKQKTPYKWLSDWFGLEVSFILTSPWYAKDDRVFHVLDNPVRKERIFGTPFLSATAWKGLLRHSCRMQAGLLSHLRKDPKMKNWEDDPWLIHLFGNEKGERKKAGALLFFPTWFDKIAFELINPHSRETRAGTNPILYEVVPAGTQGRLRLLYAPTPGQEKRDEVQVINFIDHFIDSIENLLTQYGISAKRTVGWGAAEISGWAIFPKDESSSLLTTAKKVKEELKKRFASQEAANG